jgi:RNA polymerase sigma-70 factor (sigma-E family)
MINMTAGDPERATPRRPDAAGTGPADAVSAPPPTGAGSDADQAITALYGTQYGALVRLAALLVGDVGAAEEVAQDAFIALHGAWRLLRSRDKALSFLRQSVVTGSRSVLRFTLIADRSAPTLAADMPDAGEITIAPERPAVISALRALPPIQREALVLMYYLDLSEVQVASAMGVSRAAVRSHTDRAMAALRSVLRL